MLLQEAEFVSGLFSPEAVDFSFRFTEFRTWNAPLA
jgi:hypothetical protein